MCTDFRWRADELIRVPDRCGSVKVRELINVIEGDGWYLSRQRGSHRQFHHPAKPGCGTVPGHRSDEVPKGTLASIMRQAGLTRRGQ